MTAAHAPQPATTLVVDMGDDRQSQITDHPNAAEARRKLIRTARSLRRTIDGNGGGGVLRDPDGKHPSLGYLIV